MKLADFRPTRHNVIQFLEYMVGGGVYFWSGYATFAGLYTGLGWRWFPAKIISDIVGVSLSYTVQRYWAFASRRLNGHETRVIKRYGFLTVVTYLIDYAIIWGLVALGISPYIGFFVAAGFFTIWNYFWYRFWVFNTKTNVSREVV
ncbi:MAG TPA: GtrA family protein [Candidatus Saccharimonadales bacterium]|nr:GtrA family protein [Candidatus Saccharimonadales bacterium]